MSVGRASPLSADVRYDASYSTVIKAYTQLNNFFCLSCGCSQSMERPSAKDHGLTIAADVPPTT